MKKRILTWLLAISMLGSLLTVPAGAAAVTKFSDVSDSYTATAVETLGSWVCWTATATVPSARTPF